MKTGRVEIWIALLTLAGCGRAAPFEKAEVAVPAEDPVLRSVEVWEQGPQGIPTAPPPPPVPDETEADEPPAGPTPDAAEPAEVVPLPATEGASRQDTNAAFHDFDERVRAFLDSPHVIDAVQFSCCPQGSASEDWVLHGLDDPDALVRLRALVVLMRVRAPRTVDKQWAVLEALSDGPRAVEFSQVTTRLRAAFALDALDRTLAEAPPGTEYSTPPAYQWALRAAGVTKHRGALDRLAELSRADQLNVSLAAERSLEDFEGPEANTALLRCVEGWRYNAAMRAANALLGRDPERLRTTLLAATPPAGEEFWKGVYLARLEDRRGVPILCETVPDLSIIDREMFEAIERLAGPEDVPAVEALPSRVRDGQKERAAEVVEAVRARVARGG